MIKLLKSFIDRLFYSYKIYCQNCGGLLEFTTRYRSYWKWEIKRNYYDKEYHLKISDEDGYKNYFIADEVKNNKVLCEGCFKSRL